MVLHREQERICQQLDDLNGLQTTLGNQALIVKDRGDPTKAMEMLKEQEQLCQQSGERTGLAMSLANQALILWQMGRTREGLPLAEDAYRFATTHGLAFLAKRIKVILDAVRARL
jgi:hypothetical protein